VVEVMRVGPIAAVAGAPAFVSGLSLIRGAPTPVVQVALLLGGRVAPPRRLVTVRAGGRIVALAVDAVLGLRWIGDAAEPPPLLRQATADVVSAIGALDAELLLVLNTARLIPEAVYERLQEHLDDLEAVA
jgi:purine-binding chemotaxis protein CheW